MIPIEVINHWSEQWAIYMGIRVLESSLVLALVGLVWLILRRRSPAQLGYWLFLIVLLKLLIPGPVTAGGMFKSGKAFFSRDSSLSPDQWVSPEDNQEIENVLPPVFLNKNLSLPSTSRSVSFPLFILSTLMLVWAGTVCLLFVRFLYSQWCTRRLVQQSVPVTFPHLSEDFYRIKANAGVKRTIPVVTNPRITSPVVWGISRPTILVPQDLCKRYSPAQIHWILFHELAHIRRHDNLVILFQRLIQIVFFFHPAVWFTNRMVDQQREFACDDLALAGSQVPRRNCGEAFLGIVAQECRTSSFLEGTTGIGNSKRYVQKRLKRILDINLKAPKGLSKGGIILLIGFTAFILALSSSSKEPVGVNVDSLSLPQNSHTGVEISEGGKIITVHLPGIPEGVKELEMVLIQPGSFLMGSPADERGRRDSKEWPQHRVTVSRPFYMGKYEVTQAQWEAVMGKNPSYFRGRPNHPVEKVKWEACQKFVRRLNALGQGTFRLPTEAEWEYACRAGTKTRFSFGDALGCADTGANYCEIADKYMWWSGNNNPSGTKEVGLKRPNPWGLYDMHGNVHEWCSDRWQRPYQRGPQLDPQGPSSGSRFLILWTNRVFRGGCWRHGEARECRSASRNYEQSSDYYFGLGLRLVREYQ